MDDGKESEAAGWDAIDQALSSVYGNEEPKHWGTLIPSMLGGNDPLTGLSAFQDSDDSTIWHFITYGFSELYEKEWDDPEVSGFGFELTFRLMTNDVEEEAPWVFSFLQNLARYVFETGRAFGQGHTMPINGPIRADSDTKLVGITFIRDSQLGKISTPNGSVEFLQIVSLTEDELNAIQYWNPSSFLELAAETNPKLVTNLERDSLLSDPEFARQVTAKSAEEGASCGESYGDNFDFKISRWTRVCRLKIGAFLVEDLIRRICGRIPFGRDFILLREQAAVEFIASNKNHWSIEDDTLRLEMTTDTAFALRDILRPVAGTYKLPSIGRLVIEVEKTEIKDNNGNIVKVVG